MNVPYFNPRYREDSDNRGIDSQIDLNISIHAIVKIATGDKMLTALSIQISIHAIVKIATGVTVVSSLHIVYFNPRYREDSDCRLFYFCSFLLDFNPRYREDSDVPFIKIFETFITFQSTLS